MEQIAVQMRPALQEVQMAMQQQQAALIQQQTYVTCATSRAQTAEQKRWEMARIAARLAVRADDGDINNKALRQPFQYTGKKDSDFAEWSRKVRIVMGVRFGPEILDAMGWAKNQREPNRLSLADNWRGQVHCLQ